MHGLEINLQIYSGTLLNQKSTTLTTLMSAIVERSIVCICDEDIISTITQISSISYIEWIGFRNPCITQWIRYMHYVVTYQNILMASWLVYLWIWTSYPICLQCKIYKTAYRLKQYMHPKCQALLCTHWVVRSNDFFFQGGGLWLKLFFNICRLSSMWMLFVWVCEYKSTTDVFGRDKN